MAQLIDKSAVVAEIERKIEAHKETLKNCDSSISEMVLKGSMSAYQSLLYFLDTLEVKEDVVLNDTLSKDLKTAAGNYAFTQSEEDEVLKYDAFIAGAKWQEEQTIDKACEWLADNYSKYIITNRLATIFSATIDFDTIRMIEDFKKAMEE